MKMFVGQIYIEPELYYPFSHIFQNYLSKELTNLTEPSDYFIKKYSTEHDVIFNISAKSGIQKSEVVGPTIFEKDKDVEFTIFLPHSGKQVVERSEYEGILVALFDGIIKILHSLKIDTCRLADNVNTLISNIIEDDKMFEQ